MICISRELGSSVILSAVVLSKISSLCALIPLGKAPQTKADKANASLCVLMKSAFQKASWETLPIRVNSVVL